MSKKKTLNLAVPAELLQEFDTICRHYGHAKQKGMVLSAAMLMFLRADPVVQGDYLKQIAVADIESGVAGLIDRIRKEQGLQVAVRDAARRAEQSLGVAGAVAPDTQPSPSAQPRRPRKAAKQARPAKRGITKLPRLEQPDPTQNPRRRR